MAAGCGDTAAGALGAGVVRPGMLLDTAGTASVLACCTNRFGADLENRALLVMRSVIPGVWNPLAYIGGGGLALRWFRDQFSGGDYDAMFQEANQAPAGCDDLLFSPHLGGRVCLPPPRCEALGWASPGNTPKLTSFEPLRKEWPTSTHTIFAFCGRCGPNSNYWKPE